MRKYPLMLTLVLVCASTAAAQPALIPRVGTAPTNASRTYQLLHNYFSEPINGLFTIVRAESATHTLVVKRSEIDTEHWTEWAYCKLGPEQLLDSLEDGAVTLTVQLRPAASDSSEVSVTADFEGTYGLGSSRTTAQCVSKGGLEAAILKAAGAPSPQAPD